MKVIPLSIALEMKNGSYFKDSDLERAAFDMREKGYWFDEEIYKALQRAQQENVELKRELNGDAVWTIKMTENSREILKFSPCGAVTDPVLTLTVSRNAPGQMGVMYAKDTAFSEKVFRESFLELVQYLSHILLNNFEELREFAARCNAEQARKKEEE